MAPDLSLGEILNHRSLPIVSYFRPPNIFTDGRIVAEGAVRIQCAYNSTQCFGEFGAWICARIFRVNSEMASAC